MPITQIAEPQSKLDKTGQFSLGIDLGTTNSLIAISHNGTVKCLTDEEGCSYLPSVVYYGENEILVGKKALQHRISDPSNTISSTKRMMGKASFEIDQSKFPYRFTNHAHIIEYQTKQGNKTPVEVSCDILQALLKRAQQTLGQTNIGSAVITVPAYFNEAQRQATKDAARLAGIDLLRLLNEPTAAAIAYGLQHHSLGHFLVYDLGGGTFDVSVLKLTKGLFKVLATGGNTQLGGDDFDDSIVSLWLKKYDFSSLKIEKMQTLKIAARKAKESLSKKNQTTVSIFGKKISLSRADFFKGTAHLVEQSMNSVQQVLRDCDLSAQEIDGVILVGGASRMLHVRNTLKQLFPKKLLTDLDPETVVAVGAAKQAELLSKAQSNEDWLLLDVTPLSLGIETYGGLMEKIIPRNSTIPISKTQEFTTFKDGQTAMIIHVVQGERELVADNRSLAKFTLHQIPAMGAGQARIIVTFQIDANGLLNVFAQEKNTGITQKITVQPSYGLDEKTITAILKNSYQHAKEDAKQRVLKEILTEAQRILSAINSALEKDAHLLSSKEMDSILQAIAALENSCQKQDSDLIRTTLRKLNDATEDFAARRMDQAIKEALSGEHISTL